MPLNLDRSFPTHPLPRPSEGTLNSASILRDAARDHAKLLNEMLPESREKALALTKLEESSMYSVKAAFADAVEVYPDKPAEG